VDANHVMLAKRLEEEMNSSLRDILENNLQKKGKNIKVFWCKRSF
jgi:hypothetical protein